MIHIQANKAQINIFSASDQHARKEVQKDVNVFLKNQPKEVSLIDTQLHEDHDATTVLIVTLNTAL